jgi:hypothetical protein
MLRVYDFKHKSKEGKPCFRVLQNRLFNTQKKTQYTFSGQGDQNEKQNQGIGRQIFDDQIQEGQFVESKLEGFGRLIYNSGAYYIGFFKQGKFNGYGYFHFETGGCKEGLWKDHKLLN